MKQAIKGALLSGLVFPGLGQVALGRKRLGAGIILVTTVGIALLAVGLSQRLGVIISQLGPELEQGSVDLERIVAATLAAGGGGGLEGFSSLLLLGCWLGATVHGFFLGLTVERGEKG